MMARPGIPKDARNISFSTMMSGHRFLLLIIVLLNLLACHLEIVESKVSRIQKRFTSEDVCKESVKTINIVNRCPEDEESIQKRIKEFKCKDVRDSCTSEEFVYHCVRSGNKILEVCAPRYYVTGRYCVQFDDGIGRVIEDYKVPCPECPFQHYSNESITYATCLKAIQSLSVIQSTMMSTDKSFSSSTFFIKFTPETTYISSNTKLTDTNNCTSSSGRHKRHADCNQNKATTTERSDEYKNSNKSMVFEDNHETSWDFPRVTFGIAILVVFVVVGVCVALVYFGFKGFRETAKTSMKNFDKWSDPTETQNCHTKDIKDV